LNIIHVAGTKGKGSTCAFTRSFLLAHRSRTGFPQKIGLYTSPDLRYVRERIQIDDKPIIEDLFTRYFFEVWDRLSSSDLVLGTPTTKQPRYLQLLALVAFHAFIRENVRAAIFETHHGGEFDATNVIQRPVVTGVTSLGMDHIAQLGPTIEDIAWHKAGIFKPGAPAFSVPQEPGPAEIMRERAAKRGVELTFVPTGTSLPANARVLGVPVQKLNCSLSLAITNAFLRQTSPGNEMTTDDIHQGVANFSWPGKG
jgi:folylpolyglutamate synthase